MRVLIAVILFALANIARAVPATALVEAIEFHHAGFNHYFVTSIAKEISDLDTGVHKGWARTGQKFFVITIGGSVVDAVSVCRFYGKPEKGLDSHFFSASLQECNEVKQKFADSWQFEADEVFKAYLPDTTSGACPAGTKSVYRLWNNRTDSNHRYTTDVGIFAQMKSLGFVAEGYGSPTLPVALCAPVPEGTPVCVVSASIPTPAINTTITLTASCTNAPTQYAWSGCTGTGNTCTATETVVGPKTYAVTGTNANGAGVPGSIQVNWLATPTPLPTCSLAASQTSLPVGQMLTLTAICTNNPTSYNWMSCHPLLINICNLIPSCSPASNTCTFTSSYPGTERYALEGVNGGGTGARVSMPIDWTNGTPPPPPPPPSVPNCSISAPTTIPQINSPITLTAVCSGNPTSYQWTGACTPSGATCVATSATTGARSYSVTATNNLGTSPPASLTLNWQPISPPVCTVATSNATPYVNSNITLTASCTGNPTSYAWTNCTSTTATCTTTSPTAGAQTYTVVATGPGGAGAPAQRVVTWVALPTAPPSCTVSSSNPTPTVGTTITLTASCTNNPTSYNWTAGCTGTNSTCTHAATTAGPVTYTVVASNPPGAGGGAGAPASTTVTWAPAPPTADFCGSFPDVISTNAAYGGQGSYDSKDYGNLKAASDTVWAVSFTVPAGATGTGTADVVEYIDGPTQREITLSRSRCDFRAADPSGNSGPFQKSFGQRPNVRYTIGPAFPPGTYYVNIRNHSETGPSCFPPVGTTCNVRLTMDWP